MELRQRCLDIFCMADPDQKLAALAELRSPDWFKLDCNTHLEYAGEPGRPAVPQLVHPQQVPRRSPFTLNGHCALMHSIAHIEFNAINLALDAVWRFAGMPPKYYQDWLQVACEEAQHFQMLRHHLRALGHDYGDWLAHDGLWTMCDNTRHDVTTRMALVPRTLEARGLDATPIIQAKLRKVASAHSNAAVAILDVILAEEVGHVAVGNHWYHWLCQRDGRDALAFHATVAALHGAPRLKPPFNLAARRQAGFSQNEIDALTATALHHTSLQ